MATITSEQLSAPAERRDGRSHPTDLLAEIRDFCRQFLARAFDTYRPELHYMRGPGPGLARQADRIVAAAFELISRLTRAFVTATLSCRGRF